MLSWTQILSDFGRIILNIMYTNGPSFNLKSKVPSPKPLWNNSYTIFPIRGAITKKKRETVEKTDENSQFQFGNFWKPRGGLDFSKMSEL